MPSSNYETTLCVPSLLSMYGTYTLYTPSSWVIVAQPGSRRSWREARSFLRVFFGRRYSYVPTYELVNV